MLTVKLSVSELSILGLYVYYLNFIHELFVMNVNKASIRILNDVGTKYVYNATKTFACAL